MLSGTTLTIGQYKAGRKSESRTGAVVSRLLSAVSQIRHGPALGPGFERTGVPVGGRKASR